MESGLALIEREGLEALTLRRLAGDLGATPMALYTYFRNRQELVDGVADRALGEVAFEVRRRASWRAELERFAAAHRSVLLRFPDLVPSLVAAPAGLNASRLGELVLATLERAGFAPDVAARCFVALLRLNYGLVLFEAADARDTAVESVERRRQRELAISALSLEDFPATVRAAATLADARSETQWRFALGALLDGFERHAPHPVRDSKRSGAAD